MSTAQNAGRHSHAPKKVFPLNPVASIVKAHIIAPDIEGCLASVMTERAYIGAIMWEPDATKLKAEGITEEHFTSPVLREVFTAITMHIDQGGRPDIATLSDYFDKVTDGAILMEIESINNETVSAANRHIHVINLKKYRLNRQLHALRGKLVDAANAGQSPAEIRQLADEMEALQRGEASVNQSRFIRLSEMGDRPPAINWLIKGYLVRDTTAQLFGNPGSAKSFIALDMALSIATGKAWLSRRTQSGTTFYIAGEGLQGLQRRKEAWLRYNGIDDRSAPFWLSKGATGLSDPSQLAALIADIDAAIARGEPPVLIVIDTVARNFGGGDENSTKDMNDFVTALDTLRERYRCCVLLVHHTGHADKSRARGSIALLGSLDAEYRIEKTGVDDKTITLTSTRQKDNDDPPMLAWTLTRYDLPWADEDGEPLNSCVLVPNDSIPTAQPVKDKMGNQQRQALNALREIYQRQRQNLDDAGHDPDTARVSEKDWMDAMRDINSDSSYRRKLRTKLVKMGNVRIEGNYAYLIP